MADDQQEAQHPLNDHSRRTDIIVWPPIPGTQLAYKKVCVHAVNERSIEFSDDKGNYNVVANMPFVVCSFDPAFDPDANPGARIIIPSGRPS